MSMVRLSDEVDDIDFDPGKNFDEPMDYHRSVNYTLDRTLYIHEWGDKEAYEVPMDEISNTDFGIIIAWWENMTQISFYPDYANSPGTSVFVRIVNERRPLQKMHPSWDLYEGELLLHQST